MVKDSKTGDFGNYDFSRKNPNFEWKSTLSRGEDQNDDNDNDDDNAATTTTETRRSQNNSFNEQNNASARALYISVHFFAVLCNDQIEGFPGNVNTREHMRVNFSFL